MRCETSPGDGVLEVSGLTKVYASTRAIADVSFVARPGDILALLGPNGAGKTTTLRCIAGILPPTSGSVRIGGHDLAGAPIEAKRLLALVPDDPRLFDNLTCGEHVTFYARAFRVDGHEALAERLFERFELADRRDSLGSELSRGMRQKLATICALVHSPRLLLLDEPMTGLDPRGIRTMHELIRERAAAGAAVIVSSHLLSMVERLCTRILVLHRGRTVLEGTLDELRERFPELSRDVSLEELFFHATESPDAGAATAVKEVAMGAEAGEEP
jgi:ABC-2 type transport system ATP-binding protein